MKQKLQTAYLDDMQFFRFYNLKNNRKFLTNYIEKSLISHLDLVKIQPKNILNITYEEPIDFHRLNLFNKANIYNIIPINKPNNFISIRNIFNKANTIYTKNLFELPKKIQEKKFDMIYSNIALSYQSDLPAVLELLHSLININGIIIFSIFGFGTAIELPFKLPLLDMHDIGDIIMHSGFANPVIDAQRFNLTYEDNLTLLKDLQAFGILTTKQFQGKDKLLKAFNFINNISIECVYVHAWKNHTPINNIINISKLKRKSK